MGRGCWHKRETNAIAKGPPPPGVRGFLNSEKEAATLGLRFTSPRATRSAERAGFDAAWLSSCKYWRLPPETLALERSKSFMCRRDSREKWRDPCDTADFCMKKKIKINHSRNRFNLSYLTQGSLPPPFSSTSLQTNIYLDMYCTTYR